MEQEKDIQTPTRSSRSEEIAIAKAFNDDGIKTLNGTKWETRNLYNFFHRNEKSAG